MTGRSIDVATIAHGRWSEHHLALRNTGDSPGAAQRHLALAGAAVVHQDLYRCGAAMAGWQDPNGSWPVTSLSGINGGGHGLGGSHLFGVSGVTVTPVVVGGRRLGAAWEDDHARWCRLGDLRCPDVSLPPEEQARRVFALMEEALAAAGLAFADVVRTWFFNDRILDWYDAFNAVRTAFFEERGVFDRLVPASTGIGMPNAAGAALVAGLLALRPKDGSVTVRPLPSPLQCPALDYGSSFSRAVELRTPTRRQVLVSGTASVGPGGATAHVGDVDAQVDLAMRSVHAILASRGMGWIDVTRSTAYLKRAADAPAFHAWCERNRVGPLHLVGTEADVCRDDWLFEIEVDACVPA